MQQPLASEPVAALLIREALPDDAPNEDDLCLIEEALAQHRALLEALGAMVAEWRINVDTTYHVCADALDAALRSTGRGR